MCGMFLLLNEVNGRWCWGVFDPGLDDTVRLRPGTPTWGNSGLRMFFAPIEDEL